MASGEIAARLLLLGRREYLAGLREAERANASLARSTKAVARASEEGGLKSEAAATRAGRAEARLARQREEHALRARKSLVKGVAGGFAVAAGVVGYESVKMAADFQSAMTLVNTMAGVPQARIKALGDGLLKMAPSVASGPTALADALYRISSANSGLGATNKQLIGLTKAAAQLNLIGGGNDSTLGETARVFGGVSSSGIKAAGGPQGIVSLAAATVGSGDMKMHDFLAALGTGVLPTLKNAGVGLPDFGAMLSLMTDNLISGAEAGTSIKTAVNLMANPSGPSLKGFNAVGLQGTDLGRAMAGPGGIVAAIRMLREHLAAPLKGVPGMSGKGIVGQLEKWGFKPGEISQMMTRGADTVEQNKLIGNMFGRRQSTPVRILVAESGKLDKRAAAIKAALRPEEVAKKLAATLRTWNVELKKVRVEFDVLLIKLGNRLIPVLEKLGHLVMDVARYYEKHREQAKFLGVMFGTILVIALGAFTVSMIAAGAAFIGATFPITALAIGIGALAGAFVYAYQHSETFRTVVNAAFKGVAVGVLGVIDGLLRGIDLFARMSDAVFGTHFHKSVQGGIDAVERLQNKILGIKDKTINVEVHAKLTGVDAAKALLLPGGVTGRTSPASVGKQPGSLSQFFGQQTGTGGGGPSNLGGFLSGLSGKANGGPVTAGVPYLVGERRPEVFVPSQSGRIVPSVGQYQQAGGTHLHFAPGAVVVSNGMAPEEVYRQMGDAVDDRLARQLVS